MNGIWTCSNKVTGEVKAVSDGDIFVISMQQKIAAAVFSDDIIPQKAQLKPGSTITIGREFECMFHLPDISVGRKHAIVTLDESEVTIKDLNSLNGTYVNNHKVTEVQLKDGDIISIGKFNIRYSALSLELCSISSSIAFDRILFKRSLRIRIEAPTGEIEVQAPPSLGSKPEQNWLNPIMLVTPISLIAGATNYQKQKSKYKKNEATRQEKYTDYLEESVIKIEEAQTKQLQALNYTNPSTGNCIQLANVTAKRLWELRISDSDFLNVRLGTGDIDSSVKIKTPTETFSIEEDELKTKAQATKEQAMNHRDRHVLTQHLGIFPNELIVQPYRAEPFKIQNNDILLLCSDGLTDMLSDNEIFSVLNKKLSAESYADLLIKAALEKGGKDNVTVGVIKCIGKKEGFFKCFGRKK